MSEIESQSGRIGTTSLLGGAAPEGFVVVETAGVGEVVTIMAGQGFIAPTKR